MASIAVDRPTPPDAKQAACYVRTVVAGDPYRLEAVEIGYIVVEYTKGKQNTTPRCRWALQMVFGIFCSETAYAVEAEVAPHYSRIVL